jgi:hypothetical protein
VWRRAATQVHRVERVAENLQAEDGRAAGDDAVGPRAAVAGGGDASAEVAAGGEEHALEVHAQVQVVLVVAGLAPFLMQLPFEAVAREHPVPAMPDGEKPVVGGARGEGGEHEGEGEAE